MVHSVAQSGESESPTRITSTCGCCVDGQDVVVIGTSDGCVTAFVIESGAFVELRHIALPQKNEVTALHTVSGAGPHSGCLLFAACGEVVAAISLPSGEIAGTINSDDHAILGRVHAMSDYKGHTLAVSAERNLSLWVVSEHHPLLPKLWGRVGGISQPHQKSVVTSLCIWGGFGITGGDDGTLKLWNFERSQGALPSVIRVLPEQEKRINTVVAVPGAFVVGGDGCAFLEWDSATIPESMLGETLPKSMGGHSLPTSAHLVPSKRYGKTEVVTMALIVVSVVVSLSQFMSLPFANEEMWSPQAKPMSVCLPVFNLNLSMSPAVHEVLYWVCVSLASIAIIIFFSKFADKLILTAAELKGSVNGHWIGLVSHDPAEVERTQKMIDSMAAKMKRCNLMITVVYRFVWLVTGLLFMPVMTKLLQIFFCTEALLPADADGDGNTTSVTQVWAGDLSTECYTTYHYARMAVSGAVGAIFMVVALRLSLVEGDVRLLCRTTFNKRGLPVAGISQNFAAPWHKRSWPVVPVFLQQSSVAHRHLFFSTILNVIGGAVGAHGLQRSYDSARLNAVMVAVTLLFVSLITVFASPYGTPKTMRFLFALKLVTTFAGICGVVAVFTAVASLEDDPTADIPSWPAYMWYGGVLPVACCGYTLYPGPRARKVEFRHQRVLEMVPVDDSPPLL
eukprot:TRINITY_DN38416_c0_g1_i1.p1 TRINITY_DN38416_c0_g1~~TRINITY_DN38416_c0_g1_i1.p1  ORF type:complete len:700 (+),score=220.55 TRINITY_DN38416_c0_g1_i1:66-2102(+)